MQKHLLTCLLALFTGVLLAQPIYVDQFDDGNVGPDTDKFDFTEADGELVVSGNESNGPWDGVYLGLPQGFDVTASPKLYVRVKASSLGTQLRMDLADTDNNFTNLEPLTQTLTDEFRVLEFDFSTVDVSNVDMTNINAVFFFIDPGQGGFTGQVTMDYIALGEEPEGDIMSDIYQDHMDTDSSLTNFLNEVVGYSLERATDDNGDSTVIRIVGDGTAGPWTPFVYGLRPAPEFIQTSVDISDNPKVYVKARTSVDGTTIRFDVQDTDDITSTRNPIIRVLTPEWAVYEYEFIDPSQDFPNDNCPLAATDPCPINLEAIKELVIFIDGGTGMLSGNVEIDWISFGVNLDGPGPEALLSYTEEFDNDIVSLTGGATGIEVSETDGNMIITGDGSSSPFATASYEFQEATDDQDTAFVQRSVDFGPALGRLFIRAKTDGAAQTLRIDLLDTAGLVTNVAAITQRITDEWSIYTYNFLGNYGDAGYGGTGQEQGCTVAAPCQIDASAVQGILLYPQPTDGGFQGAIEIDWISVGQPLEEEMETEPGIANYSDTLNGVEAFLGSIPTGITSTVEDGFWSLSGDGMVGQYQVINYTLRDAEGSAEKADVVSSGDKLYVRARIADGDTAVLRVDLVDEGGFVTTNAGNQQSIIGSDFATYVYDYAGGYRDGGYGGTSCPGPAGTECPVDGQRIVQLGFYPDPDTGGFDEEIIINWISFGEELMVNVRDFAQLDGLRIYPNPATDQVGVEFDLPTTSDISVSLFDGLGRRVLLRDLGRRVAGNHFAPLDLSQLAVGTYHLQVLVNGAPARAQTILKR